MKNRTKTGAIILSCIIAAASMTGCGNGSTSASTTAASAGTTTAAAQDTKADSTKAPAENAADSKHLKVVCTIFPEYDWVKQIMGDKAANADITYLLESGVDLHNYQPTADDIIRISDCDLFVYVGGESDEWVENALENAANKDMKVINLMEAMGDKAKLEEVKEGMQHEHDHDHEDGEDDHDHDHEHGHKHEKKAVSEDRTLSDYEGEWQSVYPFMTDNFKNKTASYMAAAEGFEDQNEAWDFFYKGNETDVRYVNIKGDSIEFIKEDGIKTSGTYAYDGFYSDCWGETSIRYQFRNTDSNSTAPKYVQFDDHLNFPIKAEHFHIYCGDDPTAMLDIMYNWPTYYPADIVSEEDMIHEFLKHYVDEDEDEDHDHEEGEEDHEHHHEEGEEEYDEHVWLSVRNAKYLCAEITADLSEFDPANADTYKANFNAYSAELDKLDADFKALADAASVKTVVFGDRFPFRYFVDDYGLDYFAAFAGCSAETEASFETVIFLTQKMDELGCKTIYTIENSDKSIAQTIINSTQSKDQTIAELNSLQSVSRKDIDNGAAYLSLMRGNYDVLAKTLK